MPWTQLAKTNPGTSTRFGVDQLNKVHNFMSGGVDPDGADISSNVRFISGVFMINNPANTFRYIFNGSAITANRYVTLPLLTEDDTFVLEKNANDFSAGTKTYRNTIMRFRNPANSASYIVNTSAIVGDRNITLPLLGSGDTFVFEAHTQTLTNKTLTTPIIATIKPNASTAINLPAVNDTFAVLTAAQTFSGKTIPFGTNTLTDVVSTNTVQNISGAKTFSDLALKIRNTADTASLSFSAPDLSNDKSVIFPNIAVSAYNVLISEGDQTISGPKTFANDNLRLTGPDGFRYDFNINSGLTTHRNIFIPALTTGDTFVFQNHPTTLANKKFTVPTLATNPTTTELASGESAVYKNTTTGNTAIFYNDAGTIRNITERVMHPMDHRIGGYAGGDWTQGYGFCQGGISTIGTVTYNTISTGQEGKYIRLSTTASTGSQAGQRGSQPFTAVSRELQGKFMCKFRLNTPTGVRMYLGLHGNIDGWRTGDNPLEVGGGNNGQGVILLLRSTDTNFQFYRNNTVDPASTFNSTVAVSSSTIYTVEIEALPGNSQWKFTLQGTAGTQTVSTDTPAGLLYPIIQIENSAGDGVKTMDVWWWTVGAVN